jgi:transcriptional regulator with GAF, ATPase, and Fis domain
MGLIASAEQGTIFLDEIGDLSPPGQAMLLRFLQEREVRPLGSPRTARVDVRVIAATNRDLARDGAEGRFRPDLLDRLSELSVHVPPLRERPGDVPLLLAHFLARERAAHGLDVAPVHPAIARALAGRSWPGNVRELQRAVSRAAVFGWEDWLAHEPADAPTAAPGVEATAPRVAPPVLSIREQAILHMARVRGAVTRGDVVRALGGCGERARLELVTLARTGFLARTGLGRHTRYAPALR